jgi:tetratricopeptide (TPR) repeat protein
VIPFLLALAAAAQAPTSAAADAKAFEDCAALVKSAPEQALQRADEWRLKGGGLPARQCLGLAYVALERWAPAAVAFEQAAMEAETAKDSRRADLWVQSGNSWLAANDGAKARKAFDSALATTLLTPELRGEVHLDRGRAGVAIGDVAGARADINKGLELVPADPFGWYLSAALAQREGNLARARNDIAKAVQLAPDDADVLLLAGNLAGLSGEIAAARGFFERAVKASPDTPAGKAAAAALAANPAPAPEPPAASAQSR